MSVVLPLVLALSSLAPSGDAPASRELIERGRRDYQAHCQSCHGDRGRGNGPMAEYLNVAPADLRTVSLRAGGTFPFDRVYRTIEGREQVRGHGLREMPVWGLSFQDRGSDSPQDDAVRGRILQLIRYLESIQIEPKAKREKRRDD